MWSSTEVHVDFPVLAAFKASRQTSGLYHNHIHVFSANAALSRRAASGHVRLRDPGSSAGVFWSGNGAFEAVASMLAGSLSSSRPARGTLAGTTETWRVGKSSRGAEVCQKNEALREEARRIT